MGDLSHEYFAAYLLGQKNFNIGLELLEIWDEKLTEQKKKDKAFSDTVNNNNKGIAYEKDGNTKAAIKVYRKNIEIGYPATHSYQRLMILYRKDNNFKEEIIILDKAIDLFSLLSGYDKYVTRWKERRDKALTLNRK